MSFHNGSSAHTGVWQLRVGLRTSHCHLMAIFVVVEVEFFVSIQMNGWIAWSKLAVVRQVASAYDSLKSVQHLLTTSPHVITVYAR